MPMVLTYHEFNTVGLIQCKTKPIIVILFAFTSSETMFTTKLITEIIENHSELYVGGYSCNKFVSSRS